MKESSAFAALALGAVALWATPAAAMQAAPLQGAVPSAAVEAQFRFPWEQQRAKPKKRTKRAPRKQSPKARQAAPDKRGKAKAAPAPVPTAPTDPMDAALPAPTGPLGVVAPLGRTPRERDGWAAVAVQVPPPKPPPLISEDGPAPAPAYVAAILATLQRPEPAPASSEPRSDRVSDGARRPTSPRRGEVDAASAAAGEGAQGSPESAKPPHPALRADLSPPGRGEDPRRADGRPPSSKAENAEADDDETPDIHPPMPPVRPRLPGEVAARPPVEGLAPEEPLMPGQGLAQEDAVPLPPKRPDDKLAKLEPEVPEPPPGPTPPDIALPNVSHDEDPDCRALESEGVTVAERLPAIEGPGVCGGGPVVSLTGVKLAGGEVVKIRPAATLRCGMARELAAFLRDDAAPAAEASGSKLARLDIAGSYQCRGRNGASGGKMSEHGRANAVDLSGFAFADGKELGVFSADLPKAFADKVKAAACGRFNTVLGPGSDGFHETHLHIDLQPRRSKAKLCQWADPEVAKARDEDKQDAEAPPARTARKSGDAEDRPAAKKDDAPAARKSDAPDEPLPKRERTP